MDNLQFTLPAITCALRIAIFWWKKEAITPLLSMIENDWAKPKTLRERQIMIAKAHTARIIIISAYSMMAIGLFMAIIAPIYGISLRYITNITDPGKPLPLQTYYIYDITKSPQYEITLVSQAIVLFLNVMPYTGVDNFLSLLVFHISGQLDILSNHITNLDKVANFTDALRIYVMNHMELLRAIGIIEDTFNVLLLILFLYFGTVFACFGFMLINRFEGGNYFSLSGIAYVLVVILNLFGHMALYCAVGELLTTKCDQIHFAAYSNKWYMESRSARNVILLMARTNKPTHLTIGKMFSLTIATFCNLIKTSVGYISILLTMKI